MTEPAFGFDGARTGQEVQRWVAGMSAEADRYKAMQDHVTGVTASASSKGGVVTAVVDSAGAVKALTFPDSQFIPE